MEPGNKKRKGRKFCGFSYVMGVFTVLLFVALGMWRLVHKTGAEAVIAGMRKPFFVWRQEYENLTYITPEVLEEIDRLGGVVEKAGNPTRARRGATIMSRPDDELAYDLRPDTKITGDYLRTKAAWNLNPPTLFLPADVKYSPVLEKFIKTNSRLRNTYTTGSDGRRVTLPEVKAGQTLLVVGDSVAFGMGVDDADTIPSQLQQMLGERMRVVNGGVGGYNFEQCIGMAALLAKKEKFAGLVYLACQNDFHGNNGEGDWAGASLEATERLSHLKEKFGGKVVVVLEEYLEYVNPELPAYQGWPREWLDKTDRLRETLDKSCREKSFVFRDWKNAVESYNRREKSLFADFGLYVDHCHLSPRGCRMMAELIYGALGEAGITEGIK